jgi:hypothetical protein
MAEDDKASCNYCKQLNAELVERAKAVVDRYDRALTRGHEAPGVIPFRRD